MAPAGWHPITPEGGAANIYGVALAFSIVSTIVLALRVYARQRMKQFSLEDWLMCIGWLINMVHNAVIIYGTHTGLGSPDSKIPGGPTGPIFMEGAKSVFLWQVFFLSGLVFIKVSICLTLLRIAVIKWHRTTLWVLIVITVVSTIFVDFYILLQCRPIAATWGEVPGTCLSSTITVSITFIISAFNLVTDITTALLPFLMLKDVQMTKQQKTAIISILSLGVLASIATIARLPFAEAYFATSDYLEGIGDIILWTIVECDLALIAGSLPMLRTLFKSIKGSIQQKSSMHTNSTELLEMGRAQKIRDQADVDRIVITVDHVVDHETRSVPSELLGLLSCKRGLLIIAFFITSFVAVLALRCLLIDPPRGFSLFANLYLAGTIIFGGGLVVIPLLEEYIVAEGWVSARDFLLGLAIIQAFPGPNFNFSVYLGSLAATNTCLSTFLEALIAFVAIFAPGIIIVSGVMGFWKELRSRRWLVSLLRNINAAAVGLVYTAIYRLCQIGLLDETRRHGSPLGGDPWWVAVTAASFVGGRWLGLSAAFAILLSGAMGLVWYATIKA
ncbi:hypothetical protein N8I77_010810 [Diaporthe amygdali]|uniref:Rhodopsin domain-containing protein n=1 Tax=Phomopsis amygdali TaxID=1214568 RepID=A0AAD9S807_PHOAM|nr:hypothetical protein N8I77_010810 [Diaporthe amygdali]